MHRSAAKEVLRCMASDLFLGEELSVEKQADVLENCLDWTLEGPEKISQELLDPKRTWQSQMMLDKFNVSDFICILASSIE